MDGKESFTFTLEKDEDVQGLSVTNLQSGITQWQGFPPGTFHIHWPCSASQPTVTMSEIRGTKGTRWTTFHPMLTHLHLNIDLYASATTVTMVSLPLDWPAHIPIYHLHYHPTGSPP